MEQYITLEGKPIYILFHNDTNFYTVARFRLNDEKEKVIIVTGILPEFEIDVIYEITGNYVEHPRYGMQFAIQSSKKALPTGKEAAVKYLSSFQFQGIGKKTAEKIVETLGEYALQDIRKDPSILIQVEGLSDKQKKAIEEGIKSEDDGLTELIEFLNVHGIGMRNLIRLNKAYGKAAFEKIKENPYRVIEECDGFGFKTADSIAMALGIEKTDERRLYAFLISLVNDLCMAKGDSYIESKDLEEAFLKKSKGITVSFENLLEQALYKRTLVKEENRIYPAVQHDAEVFIAEFLKEFPYKDMDPCDKELLHEYLDAMQKDLGIQYDKKQIHALDTFFENPFFIMTGGPGTGKTTVVKAMVTLFRMLYPSASIICAAPTGRAAKRVAELTGTHAATIHSLLQWDLESNTFGKDEDNPLLIDLLIIDEFSMVDSYLFSNLLRACKRVKKICIIGDEDQLPSVGPGSVLKDLIASEEFPLVRLEHIYRQKDGSDVIALAHAIRNGTCDFKNYSNDVAFFGCDNTSIKNTVITIVQSAIDKGYAIDEIQVLSPMYSGNAGIDLLNKALQDTFNPSNGQREVKAGYVTFREGDKILQLRNQPDDDVYNGDIGILEEIVLPEESEDRKMTLVVNFQGVYVEYKAESWNHITLAYCISIHKSQGSEYPIVIIPFTRQHRVMLRRNLIYTGVTRARKALVLLGDEAAFQSGIQSLDEVPRKTTLQQRLKEENHFLDKDPLEMI